LTLAASTITITVSIAIPNDMIREKFVKKFIVYPNPSSMINVARKASGRAIIANNASLHPTNKNIAKKTRIMVIVALLAREL
jgi:hypothetical protein